MRRAYERDPNWWRVQYLLAQLIAVQVNSKEKKYTPFEIAPWLETATEQEDKALDAWIAMNRSAVEDPQQDREPPGASTE